MDRFRHNWSTRSSELFELIKGLFRLDDQWTFSLETVDVSHSEMQDAQATAAFALRRIQAVTYLCRQESMATDHIVTIGSEVARFLYTVERERSDRPGPETDLLSECRYILTGLIAEAVKAGR